MRQHKHDLSRPPRAYRRPSWQPEWTDRAKCTHPSVDPEMFFPSEAEIKGDKKTDFERVRRAKQFCASCPVIKECRETFMSEPAGVFGGMSAGERARARRESAA